MKNISKVIKENLFINSYLILDDFITKKSNNIKDVNLILISKYINNLNISKVKKFYKKYIDTGLIYSLPEFFASDLVTIPKGISDVREYRFFSSFGMILYNALGVFFAEMCNDMIKSLNLKKRGIYSYTPTNYTKDSKWKINNKWQGEYKKYEKILNKKTFKSDVVLSIDISHFFNSIDHKKLVKTINSFINSQNREKYLFDENSEDILNYYFLSMMGEAKGLPQGKKNFASDYLAYLYLVNFDMEVESLIKSNSLEFVAMVRYVDDIHFFLRGRMDFQI